MRMHDLCGPLLMYYAMHKRVPASLEDLRHVAADFGTLDFNCPVSGLPYIYDPNGPSAPEGDATVVIYDQTPVHSGFRWCVTVAAPVGGQLVTKVVALPESFFTGHGIGQPAAKQ